MLMQAALERGTMSGTYQMVAEGPAAATAAGSAAAAATAEPPSGGQITMKLSWRPALA